MAAKTKRTRSKPEAAAPAPALDAAQAYALIQREQQQREQACLEDINAALEKHGMQLAFAPSEGQPAQIAPGVYVAPPRIVVVPARAQQG